MHGAHAPWPRSIQHCCRRRQVLLLLLCSMLAIAQAAAAAHDPHCSSSSSTGAGSSPVRPPRRQLQQSWLAEFMTDQRRRRMSALEQLLLLAGGSGASAPAGDAEEEPEAAAAVKRAASAQGRAQDLRISDLALPDGSPTPGDGTSNSSSSGGREGVRVLVASTQGPPPQAAAAAGGGAGPATSASSRGGGMPGAPPPTAASSSSGGSYQPLCSATINYGASVGDAGKKGTSDVPIYVGSFDVVVAQSQQLQDAAAGAGGPDAGSSSSGGGSSWVLGWQFAAGEYIQMSRDVFGDDGIYSVVTTPSLQPPAASGGGSNAAPPPPLAGVGGQEPQRVAVLSNTSLSPANANEVVFSFVGRKGPAMVPPNPAAPFRVAPPTNVFLNNHNCYPLFRPGAGASASGPGAAAAAAAAAAALGTAPPQAAPSSAQQQQQMVEVASPQLPAAAQPRELQIDYLPVEFAPAPDGPALFAKTVTQFYFRVTSLQAAGPVFLDQVLLQYFFHGPLDSGADPSDDSGSGGSSATAGGNTTAASGSGSAGNSSSSMAEVVARVSASQFRLTCSDASMEVGCGALAWNVTPGLPSVFGARFVLNIWFPLGGGLTFDANASGAAIDNTTASSSSNGGSSAAGRPGEALQPLRFLLLPPEATANGSAASPVGLSAGNGTTAGSNDDAGSSVDAGAASLALQRVVGPDGAVTLVQPLAAFQAIVAIEPRRFFANISASNDYSFLDTPALPGQPPAPQQQPATGNSSSSSGRLVRRKREPNPRMPAFLTGRLAWGSPPVGGKLAPRPGPPIGAGNGSVGTVFPPGSYCQPSPGGGLVCGVDVLFCCLGGAPLNLTAPPEDWPVRFTVTGGSGSAAAARDAAVAAGLVAPQAPDGAAGASAGGGTRALPTWGVALAVVVPACALAAAACAAALLLTRRRHRRLAARRATADSASPHQQLWSVASSGSSENGGGGGGGVSASPLLLLSSGASGRFGAAADGQRAADGGVDGLTSYTALLAHAAPSHPAGTFGWASVLGHTEQQQQQQPVRRLSALKPKVPSLPDDVMAAAIAYAKQQQQQQQQGSAAAPGSPFAAASALSRGRLQHVHSPKCGCEAALDDDEHAPQPRAATWTGWLHEDAFEDNLLDQLLLLHLQHHPASQHMTLCPATAGQGVWLAAQQQQQHDANAVWHQLQQQHQGPQQQYGAAVAAVEAAAAAINALMRGGSSVSVGGAPLPGSSAGSGAPQASPPPPPPAAAGASSFYTALMATGGVLRPPGGPPIPLNVDFAAEIQPHLGRLLGKGGFGLVYEATWRGQRVAVKLLNVDTDDPAVLDAFLKEVALCACLRGCDRVVRLLGACLGGCGPAAGGASGAAAGQQAAAAAGPGHQQQHTGDSGGGVLSGGPFPPADTPTPFAKLPPELLAEDLTAPCGGSPAGSGGDAGARPGGAAGQHHHQRHHHQQRQQQHPPRQLALIMELVEGGSLAHRIYHASKRPLSYLEILQVGLDVAAGLAYLHPAVVHRDLKPQNVLLDREGRAKLADFGISRFKDPHRSYLSVTHQGGTPNYMAPELFNASRVDEAADVYSLGCILYECLARRQPFGHLAEDGRSFNMLFKIIVAVAINKQRPPLPPDTPPRLASLITRCWAEDPGARPRVGQLLAELGSMMQDALQERADRLRRGSSRMSAASRTQSLPAHVLQLSRAASSSDGSSSELGGGGGGPDGASIATAAAGAGDGGADAWGSRRATAPVRSAMTLPAGHVAVLPPGPDSRGSSESEQQGSAYHSLPSLPPAAATSHLLGDGGASKLLAGHSSVQAPAAAAAAHGAGGGGGVVSRTSSCHSSHAQGGNPIVSRKESRSSSSSNSSAGLSCGCPSSQSSPKPVAADGVASLLPASAALPVPLAPGGGLHHQAGAAGGGAAGQLTAPTPLPSDAGVSGPLRSVRSNGPVAPPTPATSALWRAAAAAAADTRTSLVSQPSGASSSLALAPSYSNETASSSSTWSRPSRQLSAAPPASNSPPGSSPLHPAVSSGRLDPGGAAAAFLLASGRGAEQRQALSAVAPITNDTRPQRDVAGRTSSGSAAVVQRKASVQFAEADEIIGG